jgi:hypothetical protein
MLEIAIVIKIGSDPAAFSFVIVSSRLLGTRTVLLKFTLALVQRRVGENIVKS